MIKKTINKSFVNDGFEKSKKKIKRYFNEEYVQDDGNLEKIKMKSKSQQEFLGETINVNVKKSLPFKQQKRLQGLNQSKKNLKPEIPIELLKKHSRGKKVMPEGVKTKYFKAKQERKEIYLDYAVEQAARTELLLHEEHGFIEPGEEEITAELRQQDIVKNVDILSASKHFQLNLEFGPYNLRYTKNGRHLLLGGRRGHVAAIDWITKKLICEMNVMEEVADISWLHVNTMFACAQKNWVYIYDNKGIELHCIKRLYRVNRMEFLPYHFLLATGNQNSYLSWLDVSIGEIVGSYNTKVGEIRMLRQNPYNGVLCIGDGKGVVSMWSPKIRAPLAKMLCHSTPLSALTVDPKGMHLVTAGLDRKIKVWDVRSLTGPMTTFFLPMPTNHVEVSQRGVLAFAQGNNCILYQNLLTKKQPRQPYLQNNCAGFINGMRFCPYEDVLGVATAKGYQSLLVPGSGEPNFDALEDNPFQTKSQRREREVNALLEKIPPELISLDPNEIGGVDVPTLQEKVDAKLAVFSLKPPKIDVKTRRKMKGRGGSVKVAKGKQIQKDQSRKEFIDDLRKSKQAIIEQHKESENDFIPLESNKKASVLDRFKSKKRKP